jgi:membrane protease YdiL (CAAX protease family)
MNNFKNLRNLKRIIFAILLFCFIYLALPYILSGNIYLIKFANKYPLIFSEVIYFSSALIFIWILFKKDNDLGFKISTQYITKIIILVFLLQSITIISIIIIMHEKKLVPLYLYQNSILLIIFKYLLLTPIAEEIFLRGLIQSYLNPLKKWHISLHTIKLSLPVLIGGGLFGIMHFFSIESSQHWSAIIKATLSTTLLGIIAGYYREKSGSLFSAIIAHSVYNFFGVLIPKLLIVLQP